MNALCRLGKLVLQSVGSRGRAARRQGDIPRGHRETIGERLVRDLAAMAAPPAAFLRSACAHGSSRQVGSRSLWSVTRPTTTSILASVVVLWRPSRHTGCAVTSKKPGWPIGCVPERSIASLIPGFYPMSERRTRILRGADLHYPPTPDRYTARSASAAISSAPVKPIAPACLERQLKLRSVRQAPSVGCCAGSTKRSRRAHGRTIDGLPVSARCAP